MFTKIIISILALLWELIVVIGSISLFIWLCRGIWSMIKGDGPGSLPWL